MPLADEAGHKGRRPANITAIPDLIFDALPNQLLAAAGRGGTPEMHQRLVAVRRLGKS